MFTNEELLTIKMDTQHIINAVNLSKDERYKRNLILAKINLTVVQTLEVNDKVFMDTPFGVYRGKVKRVTENKITVQSYSPNGRGMMLGEYNINNNDWQKY